MKILIYTANGVGFGHLKRGSLIANELRKFKPDIDIHFATQCLKPLFLKENGFSFDRLTPANDQIISNSQLLKEVRKKNEDKLGRIIKKYKPDKIVVDAHLSGFSFPDILLTAAFENISKVLIYRYGDKEEFENLINGYKEIIEKFDKIIIPHSQTELDFYGVSRGVNKKIISCGPIVKKISKAPGKTHQQSPFILFCSGAGGSFKKGKCEGPDELLWQFIKVFQELKSSYPKLSSYVVSGPYITIRALPKVKDLYYYKYIPGLDDYKNRADLLVSTSGYNSANEIIQSEVPTVICPLLRGLREQFLRAEYLEHIGAGYQLRKTGDLKALIEKVLREKAVIKEKIKNYKKNLKTGNEEAAKIILG